MHICGTPEKQSERRSEMGGALRGPISHPTYKVERYIADALTVVAPDFLGRLEEGEVLGHLLSVRRQDGVQHPPIDGHVAQGLVADWASVRVLDVRPKT